MRIAEEKVKRACADQGKTLTEVLGQAGVSRNAFYSLIRKENILPKTVTAVADSLGLAESDLLEDELTPELQVRALYREVDRIVKKYPIHEPDNVRHTLQLLEKKPIDRLRTSLTRGQQFNFH